MTWNDRWETKLFLEGQGTARCNGSEMNNLNQVQSSWRYWTFQPNLNRKLFSIFFLILACILQFALYFLVTSEIWNDILFWYFKLLFFPDSQKCFERKG